MAAIKAQRDAARFQITQLITEILPLARQLCAESDTSYSAYLRDETDRDTMRAAQDRWCDLRAVLHHVRDTAIALECDEGATDPIDDLIF